MIKEPILHHIWQFKKFNTLDIYTISGKKIEIIHSGNYNTNAGPDFNFARIKIDNIEWNGNIEIHIKSSDWFKHKHALDKSYNNIILHVVYEMDDYEMSMSDTPFPVLELKSYISNEIWDNYNYLENNSFSFIPCEKLFHHSLLSESFGFSEKLYLDKLQNKYRQILEILKLKNNDWEATLATVLAYSFGLKVNAEIFEHIFLSLDYKIIRKISQKQFQIEALLFGVTHDLYKNKDEYPIALYKEFKYLQSKFKINDQSFIVKYLRLRPANFPSIRLSQLANLLSLYQNLFSYIIGIKSLYQYHQLLNEVKAAIYWNNHYVFDKETPLSIEKKLSKSQKDLLILNTFLPIKFAYSKSIGKPMEDEIFTIINDIKSESNSIITNFKNLGAKFSSAIDSQAFIHLYKNKCLKKQCLHCDIGFKILK